MDLHALQETSGYRNGEIDLEELSSLLQEGSSGIDPLTLVISICLWAAKQMCSSCAGKCGDRL
jgi:hypothetical protein